MVGWAEFGMTGLRANTKYYCFSLFPTK